MPVENTDLERRVLAHEQILQALMAQLAEAQPGFLDRMRDRFAGARRGAHEQDYVETADYAETFLHEVLRLVRVHEARLASPTPTASAARAATSRDANPPVVFRTSPVGGVWHVTRDQVFFGDYLAEGPAWAAARKAAREVEGQGGRAEMIFEL
jgi:hypothetical protein